MTIIDQLESLITPAVVGNDQSVAAISLLEQFYAILVSRLAIAEVYNQLQRNQTSIIEPDNSIFKQLWTESGQRELIISELAQTHHLDETETEHLVTQASHLGFGQLKNLANDQFLPAFLQSKQGAIRHYLPVWASEVISSPIVPLKPLTVIGNDVQEDGEQIVAIVEETLIVDNFNNSSFNNNNLDNDNLDTISTLNDTNIVELESAGAMPVIAIDKDDGVNTGTNDDGHDTAIFANASVNNPPAYANSKILATRRANKSSTNWLIPILLLIIALTALALLWFLVIQPKFAQPAVPVVVEPIVIKAPAPVAAALKPVQLNIAVDNSGSLYTCTANIGDINLQNNLRQVLNTSFGEQASICNFVVEQGVAIDLAGISIEKLTDILTLVRAIPFARLELQDNSMRLEAPDNMLLQQLATNMRSLLPTISVTTIEPAPLPNDVNNGMADTINNPDGTFNNNAGNNNTGFANNTDGMDPNYQPADDNTNDRVIPTAPVNNPNDANRRNNAFSNNQTSGSVSESEVDNLANTAIVAEPLRNARPVDNNLNSNN